MSDTRTSGSRAAPGSVRQPPRRSHQTREPADRGFASSAPQVVLDEGAIRGHVVRGASPVNRRPEETRHINGERNQVLQRNQPKTFPQQSEAALAAPRPCDV